MFTAKSIPALIYLLEKRNVYLYHACQYQDFCTYLTLGGIPSRQCMEQTQLSLTPFTTDNTDKKNGVWDKVFFNLDDFGRTFAKGGGATPNTYGPILFRFEPTALAEAIDVAICLRSAGAEGFRREQESLSSIADINDLFYYPIDHEYGTHRLKFKPKLQARFGTYAQTVEVSCTLPKGSLSFKDLSDIIVDPYRFEGIDLRKIVENQADKARLETLVRKRQPDVDPKLYNSLLRAVRNNLQSPSAFAQITSSEFLKKWALKIEETGGLLLKNYQRYLTYLHTGTVVPIDKLLDDPKTSREIDWLEDYDNEDEEYLYHDDDDYDEENEDWDGSDDYFLTEKDEFDMFLEELDDDGMRWAESKNDGWFYSDDDIYDDADSILRRL